MHAHARQQSPDTTRISTYQSREVVVSAIRDEENLLEIPLAVTVVPRMVLQTQRGYGIDGVLTLVPGVIGQSRSGGTDARIQIRGFGARGAGQRSNAGTSRGIRFYTDGIPETEPDGRTSFDLINTFHASSIEVIRSNASTLWGNASGGIVSVSTVPTEQTAFVDVGTTVGSFGLLRQSLLANSPLGNGQIYASITNTAFDGWREQSRGSQVLGTLGVVTRPSESTTVKLFVTGGRNQFHIPGPLTRDQFLSDPQQAQRDTLVYKPSFVQRDERRDNALVRIGTTIEHEFSSSVGVSAMGFVQTKKLARSERNTWRDFDRYHVGGNAVLHASQQLSTSIYNKILVGTDLQVQDGSILFYNLDPTTAGRGTTLRQNKREGASNVGAFVQDEVMLGALSIVAGLRYDAVQYANQDFIDPAADTSVTFSRVIPKLAVNYRIGSDVSAYASLGGGIEVPAGNETDPPAFIGATVPTRAINPLLSPIISTTYELGVKGNISSNVVFDAAAYMIDITNDIAPYNSGAFFTTVGASRRIGAELGATIQAATGLTIALSGSLMSTTFLDYTIDSGYISQQLSGRTTSYAGNEQSGIPLASATVRLRYDVPEHDGWFAEIESRTLSSYYADDANTIVVDGWTVLSAAAGIRIGVLPQHLSIDIIGRADNVLNTSYMASAWINPDVTRGGVPFIEPGLPRNMFATVNLRYTP
jgi:iron complex outermembrane receptor protein